VIVDPSALVMVKPYDDIAEN